VEEQNFAGGESEIQVGTLLNHSNQALDWDLLLPDVEIADPGLAACWAHAGGEDSYGCRLAGAVGAEQTENLSG
jgi:hypothetical protein